MVALCLFNRIRSAAQSRSSASVGSPPPPVKPEPSQSKVTLHSTESSAPELNVAEEIMHDFQRVKISGEDTTGVSVLGIFIDQ